MKAVGAYLETLRDGRGLSRVWVAGKAGTNETSVYRVERRGQQPGPKILIGVVRAVHGSFDDVDELLRDDNIPVEVGRRLAEERLKVEAETERRIAEFKNEIGEDKATEFARRLASDPDYLRAIRRHALEDDT